MSTIKPLTPEALRAQAREAAEQHIPLSEANHHEFGSKLWSEFNSAYAEARCESAFHPHQAHAMAKIIARGICLTRIVIGGAKS